MTVGQISIAFKKLVQSLRKIIVAFLFAFYFQNLDVYGCKDCCEKCCEDCGGGGSKENSEGGSKAEACVFKDWLGKKNQEDLVLMPFKSINNSEYKNDDKGIQIIIKDGKIEKGDENTKQLKLDGKKYALFEIKKKNGEDPIYLYCSDIESVTGEDCIYGIFCKCTHTEISVIACDTQEVTNMSAMFYACNQLNNLKLEKFDTGKVTKMKGMFCECGALKTLDLSNFNTKAVEDMFGMFAGCNNLLGLDLSKFDTQKVENMGGMFAKCNQLNNLKLEKFDTGKVTDMNGMFCECGALKTLDLSNFNTKAVEDMQGMFYGCENLKDINITDAFQGSGSPSMEKMFYGCTELEKIVEGGGIKISSPGDVIKYFIKKHKNTE